jgi:hypothetical protein
MLFALGFVFMFTIGGLLNHLALPLKITICWELLTILLLGIYLKIPVTMHNFEQSAGNQQIFSCVHTTLSVLVGTSETKRGPCNNNWKELLHEDIVHVIKNSLIFWLATYNLSFTKSLFYSNTTNSFETEHDKLSYNLKPIKVYNSLKNDRVQILKIEKDKSAVYLLYNNINGNYYVGSSINIASRMKNYLNNTFLKSKQNINMPPIVAALLKHDQSNFTL